MELLFLLLFCELDGLEDDLPGILKRIKKGDRECRNWFIAKYRPFVLNVVAQVVGRYIEPENSEEYSIGLLAFNEAIDSYDYQKNPHFLSFGRLVIRARVIDYLRRTEKYNREIPFTFFAGEDGNDNLEERIPQAVVEEDFINLELREEIEAFEVKLNEFGLTLEQLVMLSPKHQDSKILSIHVAKILARDDQLYAKMEKKRALPIADLQLAAGISRRTIERNRKYILAVSLVLRSGLEIMKSYVHSTAEGGE